MNCNTPRPRQPRLPGVPRSRRRCACWPTPHSISDWTAWQLADGNVQPQQVVAGGAVSLQEPASAITVGLPFQAQVQSLYLDVQEPGGTIQSKRKMISRRCSSPYGSFSIPHSSLKIITARSDAE